MTLSDLASLGSFISGIAVLVSLVFLYFQVRQVNQQVRQAERNQRATIAQVRTNRTVDVNLRMTDPSMATAFRKAMAGGEDLTATELRQFIAFVRAVLINNEDSFLQRHHGLLEDAAYRAWLATVTAAMSNPAFRVAWRMQRNSVGPEFAGFIDKLLAGTPTLPAVSSESYFAEWKSGWAELAGAR